MPVPDPSTGPSSSYSSPSDEQSIRNTPPQINIAKALQELDRGEKTASAMEDQLSKIERTIEELLARVERDTKEGVEVNGVNGEGKER